MMNKRTFVLREDAELEVRKGHSGPRGSVTVATSPDRAGATRIDFDIPGVDWAITVGGEDARALMDALRAELEAKDGRGGPPPPGTTGPR